MSEITEAAVEMHEWFAAHGVPHFFVGGIAVQFWGNPRATLDVDMCAVASTDEEDDLLAQLLRDFRPRTPDAGEFAKQHRVLLVAASNGCGVDISLAGPWFEENALKRAVSAEIAPGKYIPVCSAEDLIVYKAIAGRAQDIEDIRSIIKSEGAALHIKEVRRLLSEYRQLTDEDDPERVLEQAWSDCKPSGKD